MNEDSEYTPQPFVDNGETLISSGGTADCYKRIIGNHTYCIKRPKQQFRSSEDYMNLFRKEFELGIELEHPNIVRYFDYGEDEEGPFIKMDYVDGDGLDEFAAKHPDFFNEKKKRQCLRDELLDALAYLHGKQMLHLDLKPSNILITNNGHHVKLVDLGFAWTDGYLHDAGFSRDYCAPEQLASKAGGFMPATDIYALGRIMQRYRLAPSSVVGKCLRGQPEERYQGIHEVRKAVLRPRRAAFIISAILLASCIVFGLTRVAQNHNTENDVPKHDTVFVYQTDTVFVAEQVPELTLEDSLAIFESDLKNALAPTFYSWYGELNSGLEASINKISWSEEKGGFIPTRISILEDFEEFKNNILTISRGIVKERIKAMCLSETAKPQYEKVAQEVINYYLKDYYALKAQLERERKQWEQEQEKQ